jgi:hypothetical protein
MEASLRVRARRDYAEGGGLGYAVPRLAGEEYELPGEAARELLRAGLVERVPEEPERAVAAEPGRALSARLRAGRDGRRGGDRS